MQDFGREKMCLTIHNKKNLPNGLFLLTLRKEKFSGKNYETGTCRTNSIGFGNLDYSFSRSYNLKAAELVRKLGISFHFRHYQSAVNDKFWTFNEDFEIEFRPNSYYIPLLDKELDYNELTTNEDMEKIQNALAKAIIDKYQDGIVQNNPYRWRL